MPVFSYIAYPNEGAKQTLINELSLFNECDVIPSDNEEMVVLVTDTPDAESDKDLQKRINALDSLKHLSMVYGHRDEHLSDQTIYGEGV